MTPTEKPNRAPKHQLHPVIVMLGVMLAAMMLTYVIPAGKFERHHELVVPGTFKTVPKIGGLPAVFAASVPTTNDMPAKAAGIVAFFSAIPAGMIKSASLIFMVTFVGGMFGVLRATGAIDAGIDRLLQLTSSNVYLLTSILMFLLASASAFLGLISEYIVLIPLIGLVAQKLGLPNMFVMAVVFLSARIGYAASVSNPITLAVAQPLAGVPVFSGIWMRLAIFALLLVLGIAYVLLYLRRWTPKAHSPIAGRLSTRQVSVVCVLLIGACGLLIGTRLWSWSSSEMAAVFVALSLVMAIAGGLTAHMAAESFVEGMKSMLLPGVLIGVAGAVEIILQSSQVFDSVIQGLALMVQNHAPGVVAVALMAAEMVLDVFMSSSSGKAALSMPILAPIAHLSGVSGQVTVTAFLVGGGLMNLITPTSGILLAFLSASKVSYGEWMRFIVPIFSILVTVSVLSLLVLTYLKV